AFLFQAIPEDMVLQMASYTDPKQVWDDLKMRYLGVDRLRRQGALGTGLKKLSLEAHQEKGEEEGNDADLERAIKLGHLLEE
ncbi:hypothetical protein Tco_0280002, partial [Tanacetum coccineum]